MINPLRTISATYRCTAAALCVLFVVFLTATQPHRVHHFFDALNHGQVKPIVAEEDCEHHHNQTVPGQTRCVIQSTAQNSHLGQAELLEISFIESNFATRNVELTRRIQSFFFSHFLRRAPPIDTLFS
jgi:hypothetical protein